MMKSKMPYLILAVLLSGFSLIVLEYKLTSLSLKIPSLEEGYVSTSALVEKLELDVKSLKNPRRLLEKKEAVLASKFAFPQKDQQIAVEFDHKQELNASVKGSSKTHSYHLPIAKVFP
jgi:hypothetical protein